MNKYKELFQAKRSGVAGGEGVGWGWVMLEGLAIGPAEFR